MARKPADEYVRKVVALPVETWREIAEYRHEERLGTEAEAIRRLLLMALRAWRPAASSKRGKTRK